MPRSSPRGSLTDANRPLYRPRRTRRTFGGSRAANGYVYDGLGSVVGEVDVNGNLCCQKTTDVYGISRGVVGNAASRHGFVGGLGHYSDTETGIVYMKDRYYDPVVGRFVSQDIAKSGKNWFTYCDDDPVNKVDSTGNVSEDIVNDIISATSGITGFVLGAARETLLKASAEAVHFMLMSVIADLKVLCRSFGRQSAQEFAEMYAWRDLDLAGVPGAGGVAAGHAMKGDVYLGLQLTCIFAIQTLRQTSALMEVEAYCAP